MIIIEPHADDAFLSMGATIEAQKEKEEITIVTVFSGTRKRAADAAAFASAVGVKWIGLGFTEDGGGAAGGVGEFSLLPTTLSLEEQIILPLGIGGHPEHVAVRLEFEAVYPEGQLAYYVDQPYATKLKNADDMNAKLDGMEILSMRKPGARKWRHIPLFKDQSKFFYYNPAAELAKTFELVVRRHQCS